MAGLFSLPGEGTGEGDVGAGHIFFCQNRYVAGSLLLIFFACTCSIRPCKRDSKTVIEGMYKPKYVK